MGVGNLPSYLDYWNGTLRYPLISDVMPRNRFSDLRRFLHFVYNNAPHDNGDKLFEISPIIEAVRKECSKIEPEEYHSVDEKSIPSKTIHSKIRQYSHLASYMTFVFYAGKDGGKQRKIQELYLFATISFSPATKTPPPPRFFVPLYVRFRNPIPPKRQIEVLFRKSICDPSVTMVHIIYSKKNLAISPHCKYFP